MAKKFIGGYISNSFNGFSGPITTVEYLVVAGGGAGGAATAAGGGGVDPAPAAEAAGKRAVSGPEQWHGPVAEAGAGGKRRVRHSRRAGYATAGALSVAGLPHGPGGRGDPQGIALR